MGTTRPWQEAAAFAARAHGRQLRKDGGTPYISHPVRVALTVTLVFGCRDETVLAAALLHDVIEDTTVDYDDLLERFGAEVADLVACLSKDPRLVEPQREEAYDTQLAAAPASARLIKLADVYDNLIDARDDGSRRTLLEKARRALALAAGDADLQEASAIVRALADAAEKRLASP